jgi:hypothetical protein
MKRLVAATFAAALGTSSAYAGPQEMRAAQDLIQAKGLWCDEIKSLDPYTFGQSANVTVLRAFCDDGTRTASYKVTIHRDTGQIDVTEE